MTLCVCVSVSVMCMCNVPKPVDVGVARMLPPPYLRAIGRVEQVKEISRGSFGKEKPRK